MCFYMLENRSIYHNMCLYVYIFVCDTEKSSVKRTVTCNEWINMIWYAAPEFNLMYTNCNLKWTYKKHITWMWRRYISTFAMHQTMIMSTCTQTQETHLILGTFKNTRNNTFYNNIKQYSILLYIFKYNGVFQKYAERRKHRKTCRIRASWLHLFRAGQGTNTSPPFFIKHGNGTSRSLEIM